MKVVLIILLFTSNHLCILSQSESESIIPESRKNDVTIPTSFGQNIKISLGNNINGLSVDGQAINTSDMRKLTMMNGYTPDQYNSYSAANSGDISTVSDFAAYYAANLPALQATMVTIQASLQSNPNDDLTIDAAFMNFVVQELGVIKYVLGPTDVPEAQEQSKLRKANRAARRVDFNSILNRIENVSRHLKK